MLNLLFRFQHTYITQMAADLQTANAKGKKPRKKKAGKNTESTLDEDDDSNM